MSNAKSLEVFLNKGRKVTSVCVCLTTGSVGGGAALCLETRQPILIAAMVQKCRAEDGGN